MKSQKKKKNQEKQGSEGFWAHEHLEVVGEWGAGRAHKCSAPSHLPCPVQLFYSSPELLPFIVNWSPGIV